ncbi:group II intron maturase-specific domain-containing protein, partial [Alkalicoccus luteus]
ITAFLENDLSLTVNRDKSAVGRPTTRAFLGFSLQALPKGKTGIRPHRKAKEKLKQKVRKLLSRKRPGAIREIIQECNDMVRGWIAYYGIARMKNAIIAISQWIRRRLRQLIWKRWKTVRTRYRSLMKLKIPKGTAWQWANTRKGYWRIAGSYVLHRAISKEALQQAGLLPIESFYRKMHDAHHSTY